MSAVLDDKTSKVFEEIKGLSFMQVANLVKAFEDEFGISAAAAVAAPAAAAAAPAAAEEEATEVNVVITNAGANKIAVLKEVRTLTGLGLKEAKDLVDACPAELGMKKKDEAKQIKEKLEAAGATVEFK